MITFRLTKALVLAVLLTFTINSYAQKMTAEEVIAKHLDSIGTKEHRAKIKNQIVIGDVTVKFMLQSTQSIPGKAVLVSENNKNFFGMKLNSPDYPSERMSFDGKDGKVDYIRLGTRSHLGGFILANETLLKNGLVGGALFTAWALLDPDLKKAKISFEGTRKINNKQAYVLNYYPKGGSDLTIKLFFDKDTFQHIRTEYKRESATAIGANIGSPQLTAANISMIEEFSDFKSENNLNLPHSYRLFYSTTGQKITTEIEWLFKLNEFNFNQNLHPDTFVISDK